MSDIPQRGLAIQRARQRAETEVDRLVPFLRPPIVDDIERRGGRVDLIADVCNCVRRERQRGCGERRIIGRTQCRSGQQVGRHHCQ